MFWVIRAALQKSSLTDETLFFDGMAAGVCILDGLAERR